MNLHTDAGAGIFLPGTGSGKMVRLHRLLNTAPNVYVCMQGGAATVAGLEQGYVVCPSEKRFLLLFTFLKKNRKKKETFYIFFFLLCITRDGKEQFYQGCMYRAIDLSSTATF
jgi:hypothetical protein